MTGADAGMKEGRVGHIDAGRVSEARRSVLGRWNELDPDGAASVILPCCGSVLWANGVAARRPLLHEEALLSASKAVWVSLCAEDWKQAFDSHPRIGERKPQGFATEAALGWSAREQSAAMSAEAAQREALRDANARYERRFGRIFLVCAHGRSAGEILIDIERRLRNSPDAELGEAAQQQMQITELRLRRWMEGL